MGAGRRPRHPQSDEPLRAVLDHQARRIWHRACPEPADRRSARRQLDPRESRNPARLRSPASPSHEQLVSVAISYTHFYRRLENCKLLNRWILARFLIAPPCIRTAVTSESDE